ncbi:MAG: phosphonate C-P lyase system protein PhnG [Rubrimonas sp.]|uniref:phosphonate C-P lyase system protein PhnG n=1 Tax=Rubrimonas sp. TaxID=2036015 RepID=UPI002FDE5192
MSDEAALRHVAALETLAAMDPAKLKAEAEAILPLLGAVEVIESRSGLVTLPMRDTVRETDFLLGDVLAAEAHLRLPAFGVEGYGMVIGHDLERAMAMAVIDAARAAGVETDRLEAFLAAAAAEIAEAEDALLRRIEATRVEMETF